MWNPASERKKKFNKNHKKLCKKAVVTCKEKNELKQQLNKKRQNK